MNIKLKAALDVAGIISLTILVIAGVQAITKYIITTYGADNAINAAAFCFASVAAYVAASLLYDVRVAQLRYKEKLTEMTKK